MYDKKKFISVTSHALYPLLPLSQTVTLSRTLSPSSVTYFMDGPLGENVERDFQDVARFTIVQ